MKRHTIVTLILLVVLAATFWFVPESQAAPGGNDVGRNIGQLLRQYAGQVYGGLVAIVGLVFLLNRRYVELAMFFLAAILVGWLVFSPDQIADTARSIGEQVLG